MTALDDPTKLIATPGGYFMAPEGEERIGDVSNVLFTNGWIADEDGKVFIYYASSDTRMHVTLPSRWGDFLKTVTAAMTCCIPCIFKQVCWGGQDNNATNQDNR